MSDELETINPDQVAVVGAVPEDAYVFIQKAGQPLQRVAHTNLLSKLIKTDLVKADEASLQADLDYDADTVAIVINDPDSTKCGWYRKTGASGAGEWEQFEQFAKATREAAESAATLAEALAGITEYASQAEGEAAVTEVGKRFAVSTGTAGISLIYERTVGGSVFIRTVVSGEALGSTGGEDMIGSDDGADGSLWSTIKSFITYLRSSAGSGVIGFLQAGAGAVLRSIQAKLRDFVDPRDFGAVGDGVTDDAAAMQKALDTGKLVWTHPNSGLIFAFGTRLSVPDYGGFTGKGRLKMLTGAGKFDRSTYGGAFATNQTGIYASGKKNIRIDAVIEMEANAAVRTVNPIAIRSCTDPHIDVEVSGFKEAEFPLVTWDSNLFGRARVFGHDCNPNSTTLGSAQLTVFGVDANRVGGVNSIGWQGWIIAKNVLHGDAAAAVYGYQSDACNIQTTGYSGAQVWVYADTVGEPFDCFGDGVKAHVVSKNAYEYGLKLIHGAENGIYDVTVDGFRRYGVVLGSDSTTKSVRRNRIRATVGPTIVPKASFVASVTAGSAALTVTAFTSGLGLAVGDVIHDSHLPAGTTITALGTGTGGVGTYTLSANASITGAGVTMQSSPSFTAAFATDGTSATYKPVDNYIEISYTGDGVTLDYGVKEASGSRNTIRRNGSGHAIQAAKIDGTAGSGADASTVINERKADVWAYLAAQTISPGSFVAAQYYNELRDATGEFNAATGIYTADSERDIEVYAVLRTGASTDQKTYDMQVKKAGSEVGRMQNKSSGTGNFSSPIGPIPVHVTPGDTVQIFLNHNEAGDIAFSSDKALSYLYIKER